MPNEKQQKALVDLVKKGKADTAAIEAVMTAVGADATALSVATKMEGVAPEDRPAKVKQVTALFNSSGKDYQDHLTKLAQGVAILGQDQSKLAVAYKPFAKLSAAQKKKLPAATVAALNGYDDLVTKLKSDGAAAPKSRKALTDQIVVAPKVADLAISGACETIAVLARIDRRTRGGDTLLDPNASLDDLTKGSRVLADLTPLVKPFDDSIKPFGSLFSATSANAAKMSCPICGKTTKPNPLDHQPGLKCAQTHVQSLVAHIPEWLSALNAEVLAEVTRGQERYQALIQDPKQPMTATALARHEADIKAGVDKILTQINPLLTRLEAADTPHPILPPGFDPVQIGRRTQEIKLSLAKLETVSTMLLQSPGPYLDDWQSEQINLYYIDDVPRLIRVLSPGQDTVRQVGGDGGYQSKADDARKALVGAGQDVANAQAGLNDARSALEQAREALRVARLDAAAKRDLAKQEKAKNKKTQRTASAETRRLQEDVTRAQARVDNAQRAYDDAKTRRDSNKDAANQAALEAAFQSARTELEASKIDLADKQAKLNTAQGGETDASSDATNAALDADKEVQALENQVTALETQAGNAAGALSTATNNLRTKMAAVYIAAQEDNLAFARARDASGPIWQSVPTPDDLLKSTDPIRRVMLFGEPNGKTVFIRGQRKDVNRVKQMIGQMDRPQAQSEMTVYSVEISGLANGPGTREAGIAMQIVDDELAIEKIQVQTATRLLRALIDAKVRSISAGRPQKIDAESRSDQISINALLGAASPEIRESIAFYDSSLIQRLLPKINASELRKEFLGFSEDRELLEAETYQPIISVLPRPTGTSTIAEALVVLSLAKPEYRKEIAQQFRAQIWHVMQKQLESELTLTPETRAYYMKNPLGAPPSLRGDSPVPQVRQQGPLGGRLFGRLMSFLEDDHSFADDLVTPSLLERSLTTAQRKVEERDLKRAQDSADAAELSTTGSAALDGFRRELINELRARVTDAYYSQLDRRFEEASDLVEAYGPQLERLWELVGERAETRTLQGAINCKESKAQRADLCGAVSAVLDAQHRVVSRLRRMLLLVSTSLGLDARDYDDLLTLMYTSAGVEGLPRDWSNRISAQSGMIYSIHRALRSLPRSNWYEARHAHLAKLNEGLKEMLKAFDEDVRADIQEPMIRRLRERLLERHLNVGVFQRTSVIASNRLVARVDPQASAQIGPAKEVAVLQDAIQLGQLYSAAQTGGLAAVLGGANALPKEGQSGLYGITSGNLFQVTPIFDPTGQALRFKFDYVLQTQVREPDGTIDPQLSKIERHGVNTEVQLSNYEMGRISQFNANSQVGIPTRKTGGLPLFKDIYPFSEIPLLGWFNYRHGHAGQVSQSLILASTAMYPTIQDIIEVLGSSDDYVQPNPAKSTGGPSPR